ncbi:MAG: DUF3618 domain-containing protein [Microbacteriaceae bacterium]|nr:DUF3618 domain-containing protein [Microbacteriaceae bacterium]
MSDETSTSEIQQRVAKTRAQLEETLDAIEDKLNVPKQLLIAARRLRAKFEDDPLPWIAATAGVVVLAGAVVIGSVARRD